jgi:hypothetical protein
MQQYPKYTYAFGLLPKSGQVSKRYTDTNITQLSIFEACRNSSQQPAKF